MGKTRTWTNWMLGLVLAGAGTLTAACDDEGSPSGVDAAAGSGGAGGAAVAGSGGSVAGSGGSAAGAGGTSPSPDGGMGMDGAAGATPTGVAIWALDANGKLISFRSSAPSTITSSVAITGLASGETLVGITIRPATGDLLGLGTTNRLYTIAKATGVATAVGAGPFAPALVGTAFGFDFNPVVDRIRLVSDQEQNLRLHPTMGTVVDGDANTPGVQGDPNLTPPGNVVAAAYTSDTAPPTAPTKTTIYVIDSATDQVLRQGGPDGMPSPNLGVLTPVGLLGVDTSATVGFDIEPVSNTAYASLTVGGVSGLYTINLATGAATLVGAIGGGAVVKAIALESSGPTLYARLGGATGIRTVVTDFVGRVVADPKINGYFLNSNVDGGRLTNCLLLQMGALTGGPETYPSMGCRSMKASHKDINLNISMKDFEDLAGHLVAALQQAGVSQADVMTIVNALTPMAGDIVQDPTNNATVYQRVGRKPAINTVIDQFITKVVGDVRIAGFFTTVNAARLKTCLVRQVCGIDGPCKYGMEVDGEPGVSKSNPCRGMKASHQNITVPRTITITDFNALVEDLVMVLDGAGVAAADKNAILGALGPMCRDIVDGGTGCPQ